MTEWVSGTKVPIVVVPAPPGGPPSIGTPIPMYLITSSYDLNESRWLVRLCCSDCVNIKYVYGARRMYHAMGSGESLELAVVDACSHIWFKQ